MMSDRFEKSQTPEGEKPGHVVIHGSALNREALSGLNKAAIHGANDHLFPAAEKLLHHLAQAAGNQGRVNEIIDGPMSKKDFAQAIKELDNDDFRIRKAAETRLTNQASLAQLVHFRDTASPMPLDQTRRLDSAITRSVAAAWNKFEEDPNKNQPDVKDKLVVDRLFKGAPSTWLDAKATQDGLRQFVFSRDPHTAAEIAQAAKSGENLCAFSDWLRQASKQEGSSQAIRDAANNREPYDKLAKSYAVAAHLSIADGDGQKVSDADTVSQVDKNLHARAAFKCFKELINSDHPPLMDPNFSDCLSRFLNDKSLPPSEFLALVKSATDKSLQTPFDAIPYQDARFNLLHKLGDLDGLPVEQQKAVEAQFKRLSVDLEKQVSQIEKPETKFFAEDAMARAYHFLKRPKEAEKMLERVKKTIATLPEGRREKELSDLEERWKKLLEKK
jgi:hypothetical protein